MRPLAALPRCLSCSPVSVAAAVMQPMPTVQVELDKDGHIVTTKALLRGQQWQAMARASGWSEGKWGYGVQTFRSMWGKRGCCWFGGLRRCWIAIARFDLLDAVWFSWHVTSSRLSCDRSITLAQQGCLGPLVPVLAFVAARGCCGHAVVPDHPCVCLCLCVLLQPSSPRRPCRMHLPASSSEAATHSSGCLLSMPRVTHPLSVPAAGWLLLNRVCRRVPGCVQVNSRVPSVASHQGHRLICGALSVPLPAPE